VADLSDFRVQYIDCERRGFQISSRSCRRASPRRCPRAAVELYSGGAYRTGDLDFAGSLGEEAAHQLRAHGFEKHGRHWIHEEHQIFLEFPRAALETEERAATIEVGEYTVLVIGLEELIVDRLAAWQFWRSEVDGVNAFLLVRASESIDWTRLRKLSEKREVVDSLDTLEELADRDDKKEISDQDLEAWSRDGLERTE
jgi:hypothetical protein